jgi:LysM domain
MIYEPPQRVRPRRPHSTLDSPVLAGTIILVVLGFIGVIVLVPGVLPSNGGPGQSVAAGAPSPTPAGPTPVVTFARPTPSPPPTFLIYRVERGDTLTSLAKRFDTTDRSISWWNRGYYPSLDPESPGYDPNTIRVGWELNILRDTIVDNENPPAPIGTPRESHR